MRKPKNQDEGMEIGGERGARKGRDLAETAIAAGSRGGRGGLPWSKP